MLTNFGDAESAGASLAPRSRGAIPSGFLASNLGPEAWAHELMADTSSGPISSVGGFSLVFGQLQDVVRHGSQLNGEGGDANTAPVKGLALLSNRTPDVHGLIYLLKTQGEIHALSNAQYGDDSWPKVHDGEHLLKQAIPESVAANESQDELLERLFALLCKDTLPRPSNPEDCTWDSYSKQLRNSIFIPTINPVEASTEDKPPADGGVTIKEISHHNPALTGAYGTQKQTIILVDRAGKVVYVERTLFDEDARPVKIEERDRRFEFQVENW